MPRRRSIAVSLAVAVVAVLAPALVLPVAPAAAGQDVADMSFLGTDREPGGDPGHFVGVGLPGGVKFFDGDLPPAVARWGVRVRSTSDPAGLLVSTRRSMRSSAYYRGSFGFSTAATSQVGQRLLVADGDTVTFSYLDASNSGAAPRTVEVTTTWRAGSAQPDSRSLVFSTADPAAPVVMGEYHAVAPSATVRVYTAAAGGSPIGTGQADGTGAFRVVVARQDPVPSTLWVAAVEGSAAESPRVPVDRAVLTGRVVYPETGVPVTSAVLWIRPPGGTSPCDEIEGPCTVVSALTYLGGRFAVSGIDSRSAVPSPGEYDIDADWQGYGDHMFRAPWVSGAYGTSTTRRTTVADMAVTVDVGDIALTPPHLMVRVTGAAGFPVPEADLWVESPAGDPLPGGGYTRPDGRAGLFFPDGDYRLWVRPPVGCAGYSSTRTGIISVRGGVATPSTIDVALDPGVGGGGSLVQVPVAGGSPVSLDLTDPASPVGLLLDMVGPNGHVSAGCRSVPVPTGVTPVGPGVQLETSGVELVSARVCLGYTDEQVTAAGADPAAIELYHLADDGGSEVVTTGRDAAGHQVCGVTSSFSGFVLGVPGTSGGGTTTDPPAPVPPAPMPPAPVPPAPRPAGYWMVGADGAVYAFGSSRHLGAPAAGVAAADLEPTPSGGGYWVVDEAGAVFAFGDALWAGRAGALAPGEKVTSLSATPTGRGYWLFTTLGRALPFGDAPHVGDMGGVRLNGPVLDSVPTPSGRGYYLVAADGGIFAFGDAVFHGSMGGSRLNAPVQSLVPDGDGDGYWLVASDGGVFAFRAAFRGSMGAARLNAPVTGMVRYGTGYLMVGSDGGIFNFSDRPFLGSLGDRPPARPIVAVASLP